ncbi:MAG: methionyl-tRNA formyltransferase [Patescibacteria group bacterium]
MELTSNEISKAKIVFFGTPDFAVTILETLKEKGVMPNIVVTRVDKPQGRKMILTSPPVKIWAQKNNIPVLQPEKLDYDFLYKLKTTDCELFIVAAYGKILPKTILEIPLKGVLNVHPSLLPKFRGPSPIESAILAGEKETGVTIMLLDEEMDHGPTIKSEKLKIKNEIKASELEKELARIGGNLLADIIPKWIAGEIKTKEQNHSEATYTQKIKKEDGLIDLNGNAEENYCKYRAFDAWPGIYFFVNKKRVIIKNVELTNGEFKINRVLPEGKKEMNYPDFLRGI